MSKGKILVVEDEVSLARFIELELKHEGYQVFVAYDGRNGYDMFYEVEPDIVLLDLMLPQLSGLEVCRRIRKNSKTPIIMLTAKSETMDKVVGLDNGADDYITKPFAIEELFARMRAALRRLKNKNEEDKILYLKNLTIDISKRVVKFDDTEIELTKREFELLVFLIQNKNITTESTEQINPPSFSFFLP